MLRIGKICGIIGRVQLLFSSLSVLNQITYKNCEKFIDIWTRPGIILAGG
jgi:hypothetical protein